MSEFEHDSHKEVVTLDQDPTAKPGHLKGIQPTEGRVGAIETLGAVDGPGLRTVVFMQGCPLRCKFCHNIDMAQHWPSPTYTADRLFEEVIKNKPYWQKYDYNNLGEAIDMKHIPGGVTFSGGEPTMQTPFLLEVLKKLHQEDVHTAVDTCLYCNPDYIDQLFPHVNLWMISIKQLDTEAHQKLTGVPNKLIINNLQKLDQLISQHAEENPNSNFKPQIRIRFVLIPSVVSATDYLERLANFVLELKNLEVLELLPYSLIGKQKWIDIYGEYGLEGIDEPTQELIQSTKEKLESFGLQVKL